MVKISISDRRLILVAAAILGVTLAGTLAARSKRSSELAVYATAAKRMMGGEEIYLPTDRKAFTYPPFFAIPFMPIAELPVRWQRSVWWSINISLAGLAIWLVMLLTAA